MSDLKRTVKDSVFSFLFSQPEYMLQLYQALHPEDTHVTEADLKLVTLENILSDGIYNDLGIQVGNKLILLVEAQSTFSTNIALRMLLYLAATYKEYVEEQMLDLYSSRAVSIPRPEMYVVYTGSKADVPDTLKLSELYQGEGDVEVTVKVLRDDGTGDIVDQYVRFCKIADEQRKKYGYTREAVAETLRLCLEENILTPFLASRQKEVQDIMVTLFSQEKVTEIREHNLAKAAKAEGLEQGLERGILAMISTLKKMGLDQPTVKSSMMGQFSLTAAQAEEKLRRYWNSPD